MISHLITCYILTTLLASCLSCRYCPWHRVRRERHRVASDHRHRRGYRDRDRCGSGRGERAVRGVQRHGEQRLDLPVRNALTRCLALALEIVVPARNEALRLPGGLAVLCQKAATLPLPTAILVVDSASTDGTGDVVRRGPRQPVPVRLLRCERPGKGVAVRAGLLATRAPFVGFCDADMATDLGALDTAVSLLTAGHPLVIGSRALEGSVTEVRSSAVRRVGV